MDKIDITKCQQTMSNVHYGTKMDIKNVTRQCQLSTNGQTLTSPNVNRKGPMSITGRKLTSLNVTKTTPNVHYWKHLWHKLVTTDTIRCKQGHLLYKDSY